MKVINGRPKKSNYTSWNGINVLVNGIVVGKIKEIYVSNTTECPNAYTITPSGTYAISIAGVKNETY